MSEKKKKKAQEQELDTQTTFADMNVEGFSWYDKRKKQGKQKTKVTKREFWTMVRAAYAAYLPLFGILFLIGGVMFLMMWLWLGR